jgi:type II secretory ATPase GspE/PulE/Tfp pilus assembly ATPase PilB-like protein
LKSRLATGKRQQLSCPFQFYPTKNSVTNTEQIKNITPRLATMFEVPQMTNEYTNLLYKNLVPDGDLQNALSMSQNTNQSLETTLINHFQVPKETIGESLSSHHNCKFIAYDPNIQIAAEILLDLDTQQLLKDCWIPISWDENGVVVLVDDPSNPEKTELIKTALQTKKAIFTVGIKEDIETFINQSADPIEIFKLVSAAEAGDRPIDVPRIVDIMLSEAYRKGATDIHFESSGMPENDRVLFCMDGEYLEYMTVPEDVAGEIVKRIKSMANLDAENHTLPKIGFVRFHRDNLPEFRMTAITRPNNGLREVVDLRF